MSEVVLSYRIDADDRIAHVGDAWDEFADANEGSRVRADRVIGRSLWSFVTDSTIHDIYRRLVKVARAGRASEFRYRCDAPASRRVFRMRISADATGSVTFNSQLQSAESRPPLALLGPRAAPTENFVRICSWCHSVAWPGEGWRPLEQSVEPLQLLAAHEIPGLTHGICDPCAAEMFHFIRTRA